MSSSSPGRGVVEWDGRKFPLATLDGDVLPDAFVHEQGLLPHLHENLRDLFPRAKACKDAGDQDPPGKDGLEERGTALGKAPEQKKEAIIISSCSDDPPR